MDREKIIEGNKLIAEFLGWKKETKMFQWKEREVYLSDWDLLENTVYDGMCPADRLEFHTSWDWLMPVVMKIEAMRYNPKTGLYDGLLNQFMKETSSYSNDWYWEGNIFVTVITDMNDMYKRVIQFIKWYNYKQEKNMKNLKVVSIDDESIEFENGIELSSNHDTDCCESHYLSLEDLSMEDFEGLEFDLSNDNFFQRIEDYGIVLIPVNGHSICIPGYGYNNGYYSADLELILTDHKNFNKYYDITECQVIDD